MYADVDRKLRKCNGTYRPSCNTPLVKYTTIVIENKISLMDNDKPAYKASSFKNYNLCQVGPEFCFRLPVS